MSSILNQSFKGLIVRAAPGSPAPFSLEEGFQKAHLTDGFSLQGPDGPQGKLGLHGDMVRKIPYCPNRSA